MILPTYNEEATICAVIESVLEFVPGDVEVVVVDDGDDATAELVRERWGLAGGAAAVSHDPTVCLIDRDEARGGLAGAVLDGMHNATGEVVAVMDADGQHPPTSTATLVECVRGGADLAVGSRHTDTGSIAGDWPAHRRAISRVGEALAYAAVPPARQLTDPMSGLFAVRRDCLALDQLRPTGFKILLEILARCPVDDVVEMGYTFDERTTGESSLGPREYARYVRHLARLTGASRRQTRRPLVERDEEVLQG